MADSLYANSHTNRAFTGGGSERLTIITNAAQGSDIPCVKAFIQATTGNTGVIRMRIGTACTATTGIHVVEDAATNNGGMWIEVDNLNKLYFYGANDADTIDILYQR